MFSMSYSRTMDGITDGHMNLTLEMKHSVLSRGEHLLLGAYLTGIGILSLIGNGLLILLVACFPRLRSSANLMLMSLALVDLGMTIFGFPFSAASNFHYRWLFGYLGCQWYGFNGMLFGFGSIGMLTVISIERYVCILKRDTEQSSLTKFYTILISSVWANALFWALVPVLGWARYDLEPSGAACTLAWWKNDAGYISYTMCVFFLCYVLPIVVMTFCYAKVIRFVRLVGDGGRQENLEWTNEKDIVKTSVTCVVMFMVLWAPYAVICLWAVFADPRSIPPKLTIIPAAAAKSSAFINPFIYAATCRRIRLALQALLRGRKVNDAFDSVVMTSVPTHANQDGPSP